MIPNKKKKTSFHNIAGIIFDLDNTLYPFAPAHAAALDACRKKYPVSLGVSAFAKRYSVAQKANWKYLGAVGSCHNRLLYFQRMLEKDNCFSPQTALLLSSTYWITFIQSMKLESDLRTTLLALVKKHKIGLLSDLTSDVQFAKLTAHRLWPFFDAVVTSEEAGVEKPNTAGLKLLLSKMKLRANQVIIVGDNPATDGLLAKRTRIPFIQISRSDVRTTSPRAIRIKKLREILKYL